jgi:hypothetical protein
MAHRVSQALKSWFRRDHPTHDFLVFKELIEKKIIDRITNNACSTPEQAFALENQLLGMKQVLHELEYQKNLYEEDLKKRKV